MASGTVKVVVEGPVATMIVARPEKLNALDLDMLAALAEAADAVEADRAVRVAILTGEGKGFSAGGDIRAWGGMEPQEFGHAWVRHGHRIFERLATLRMPLIAALNGHALGGGLELAGIADIRIAEEHIRIGLPETARLHLDAPRLAVDVEGERDQRVGGDRRCWRFGGPGGGHARRHGSDRAAADRGDEAAAADAALTGAVVVARTLRIAIVRGHDDSSHTPGQRTRGPRV